MAMSFPKFAESFGRSISPIAQGRIGKRTAESEFAAQRGIEEQKFLRQQKLAEQKAQQMLDRQKELADYNRQAEVAESQRRANKYFRSVAPPSPIEPTQYTPKQKRQGEAGRIGAGIITAGGRPPSMTQYNSYVNPEYEGMPKIPRGLPPIDPPSYQRFVDSGGKDYGLLEPRYSPRTPKNPKVNPNTIITVRGFIPETPELDAKGGITGKTIKGDPIDLNYTYDEIGSILDTHNQGLSDHTDAEVDQIRKALHAAISSGSIYWQQGGAAVPPAPDQSSETIPQWMIDLADEFVERGDYETREEALKELGY